MVEGKLVTYDGGCFMLRVLPSAGDTENAVHALYKTNSLYLDSILSRRIWYRFKDYQAPLPPEIESDAVILLDWNSKYGELDCQPDLDDEKYKIIFGESTCRARLETLLDIAQKLNASEDEVKKALVLLILFLEALRFPKLERWMLTTLANKRELCIPKSITMLFHKWGTLSKVMHKGRHNFKKFTNSFLKHLKTYDDVCNVLGVVNKVNQRKEMNEQAKKKRREAAEVNSDSERRRRRKKKSISK